MADDLRLYRQAVQEAQAIAKAYPSLKSGGERLYTYIEDVHMPAKNYRSLKEDLEPVATRLRLSTIACIDNIVLPALQAQTPWAKVGRADAVRYLVQLGIDASGFSACENAPEARAGGMPPPRSLPADPPQLPQPQPAPVSAPSHIAPGANSGAETAPEPGSPATARLRGQYPREKVCKAGHTYWAVDKDHRCQECRKIREGRG